MLELIDYIRLYSVRGACQCGKCADAPPNPKQHQPTDHTADLCFFKVSAIPGIDAERLRELVNANKEGHNGITLDFFDGEEHSYIEIGGWIGDQGLALTLMGLGAVCGLWKLLTPRTMMGNLIPDDLIMKMAGAGYVTVKARK